MLWLFFFSSRRRHTRFDCDWSSDVCSSDLIPGVNTALMIGCLLLVLGFESSSALGAAYGVAVTGTMAVTTLLFYVIARQRWHWSAVRAGALAGAFFAIDCAFFGANIIKIAHGGWVPLAIGGGVFLLICTLGRGNHLLPRFLAQVAGPLHPFLIEAEGTTPPRRRRHAALPITPDPQS